MQKSSLKVLQKRKNETNELVFTLDYIDLYS
jgi:hypothetical protein